MPEPYRQRCVHLTCKSMQVYGEDFEQDPEYQAGMVDFWCTQTFRARGPDGDEANVDQCSNPERSCYTEFIEFEKPPEATA